MATMRGRSGRSQAAVGLPPRVLQHTLETIASITSAPADAEPDATAVERLRSSVYALKHSARGVTLSATDIDSIWCALSPQRLWPACALVAEHSPA
jgi:hypothetical protein